MTKINPTEWKLPFLFRDKKTMLLYNDKKELSEWKKSMNQRPEQIYITYLFYNHNVGKYNITTRISVNQSRWTLKRLIEGLKIDFIPMTNREYSRKYALEGTRLEALKIIGFSLYRVE